MGEFVQFAKILEGKLRKELRQELLQEMLPPATSPAKNSSDLGFENEIAHLAWLLGQTPTHRTKVAPQQTPYQKWAPRPKPRPDHKLSADQEKAFHTLKTWSTELPANFSRHELKAAFRKAAMATHPDRGGSADRFWEAQSAYQSLSQLFLNQ